MVTGRMTLLVLAVFQMHSEARIALKSWIEGSVGVGLPFDLFKEQSQEMVKCSGSGFPLHAGGRQFVEFVRKAKGIKNAKKFRGELSATAPNIL